MYESLGGYSGAVLGYINGGYRGAIAGYKLAKRLSKTYPKMPPIRNKRKHSSGKYVLKRKVSFHSRKKHKSTYKHRRGKPRYTGKRKRWTGNKIREASQQISQHNDMSYKTSLVIVRKKKYDRKIMGRYWYENTWDFVNNGTDEGKQNTDETKRVLTRKQIVGTTSANRLDNDNWAVDPILLNPFVNADSVPSLYFDSETAKQQDKFHLEYYTEKLHLMSLSLIPMKVKIYWFQYKKTTGQSVSEVWTDLLSKMSLGQSAPIPAAYTNQTTAIAGQPLINDYGMDPLQCPGFKRWFRVLKAETVILQPGDQRYYSTKFEIHKTYERAVFEEIDSNSQYIGGHTIVPFIITYGGLTCIKDDLSGSRAEVTPGQTKYGAFVQQKFCFRAVKNDRINSMRWYPGHIQNSTGANDHAEIPKAATAREYFVNDVDQYEQNTTLNLANVP